MQAYVSFFVESYSMASGIVRFFAKEHFEFVLNPTYFVSIYFEPKLTRVFNEMNIKASGSFRVDSIFLNVKQIWRKLLRDIEIKMEK